uniref:Chromosome transmission fidelity factor 8 n=6 Tax=Cercopithecidae TaxID=9527 RepID=A0A2K5LNV9_CERAT
MVQIVVSREPLC